MLDEGYPISHRLVALSHDAAVPAPIKKMLEALDDGEPKLKSTWRRLINQFDISSEVRYSYNSSFFTCRLPSTSLARQYLIPMLLQRRLEISSQSEFHE